MLRDKDSSEFLCYGWPEIGNFEDVDRMFRSCDSTFGLGVSKEDELGWLSSTDDLGGCGDLLKLDVKFPCPEPKVMENISENHDSSKVYSTNDSAMTTSIGYKNSSWNSQKTDSYMSFVIEPAVADRKRWIYPHRQYSHLSDPASVNVKPSTVKSEPNGLTSVLQETHPMHHAAQCTESFRDPPFEVSALAMCEQGERQIVVKVVDL
ncbi:UNVERIFIED_CONTAM: protein LNK1 [Sesamum angustifolium]|uniref:Protein LNK1 n=1 Tax=Sesamum angustifolium TaxID=2727405 RepID=A0AAW2MSK7_9LAMI